MCVCVCVCVSSAHVTKLSADLVNPFVSSKQNTFVPEHTATLLVSNILSYVHDSENLSISYTSLPIWTTLQGLICTMDYIQVSICLYGPAPLEIYVSAMSTHHILIAVYVYISSVNSCIRVSLILASSMSMTNALKPPGSTLT
jgi:hypothetical protein